MADLPRDWHWDGDAEPGAPVWEGDCPSCGAHLDVRMGDDEGDRPGVIWTPAASREPTRTDVQDLLIRVRSYQDAINALWDAQNPEEARDAGREPGDEASAQESASEAGQSLRLAAYRVQRRIDRGQSW